MSKIIPTLWFILLAFDVFVRSPPPINVESAADPLNLKQGLDFTNPGAEFNPARSRSSRLSMDTSDQSGSGKSMKDLPSYKEYSASPRSNSPPKIPPPRKVHVAPLEASNSRVSNVISRIRTALSCHDSHCIQVTAPSKTGLTKHSSKRPQDQPAQRLAEAPKAVEKPSPTSTELPWSVKIEKMKQKTKIFMPFLIQSFKEEVHPGHLISPNHNPQATSIWQRLLSWIKRLPTLYDAHSIPQVPDLNWKEIGTPRATRDALLNRLKNYQDERIRYYSKQLADDGLIQSVVKQQALVESLRIELNDPESPKARKLEVCLILKYLVRFGKTKLAISAYEEILGSNAKDPKFLENLKRVSLIGR